MIVAVVLNSSGRVPLAFESDLTVMHPRPSPAFEAQDHIARQFGVSPDSMTIYLRAASPDQLLTLAYEVERRLKNTSVPGVSGTFGLASLLPDPRFVASRRAAVSSADAGRVVSDFHDALVENGFSTKAFEGYSSFLKNLLTKDSGPGISSLVAYRRIAENVLPAAALAGRPPTEALTIVFIDRATGRDRAAGDAAIRGVRAALSGLSGATLTGLSVAGRDAERTVRGEVPRLILAAIVIVALYLVLHFRSAGDALLSLIPTMFGMLVAGAVLGLAAQRLNMVNLVAIPLLIGIDVDYGIFLVNTARLRWVRSQTSEELSGQIAPPTHAVVVCAVATILGYLSLLWTSVPAERSLGIAAAAGIGACLLGVLFLLLPLLFRLSRRP
jgi:predicted RND superfamily exporter protein